ncbi:hypothetical protein PFICI_09988 [Pestalotiopsis fici W106-1]|uniref:Heterokaryon incompatibility domain-containing protein n=1 Tax=Pestalotiopsis fici (strain W106-1 / CGMCC3.15140) TaxID=1229662 RepID=W3WYG3_PESFW|nr:uncharacterized protein PFICI_09988 [Pestalotiopsis fici W106-1]ETS77926.1 hypothetical protein PFICI_09988 [Pestalotiopsis fici W106-1]
MFVVFKNYQKVYIDLLEAYRKAESNDLSLTLHSNSKIYVSMSLTPEEHENQNSPTMIRLLTLLPGSRQDSIECFLNRAYLSKSEMPEFDALSYVWGRDAPGNSITINGSSFVVSASVYQALTHLRHARSSRTLWIDAICINQCDIDERAAQVLIMSKIYCKAQNVLVWLGPRVPLGLPHVLEHIKALSQNSRPRSQREPSSIHYGTVKAIIKLLEHPWWSRVWVVQEIVVARQAFIICGRQKIEWNRFCRLVHSVASYHSFHQHSRGAHFKEFIALEAYCRNRAGAFDRHGLENEVLLARGTASDVLSPVFDFRMRDATDVRDKIFALQGVIDAPILQKPDYTKQAYELTLGFSKQHIRNSKGLSILNLADCMQQSSFHLSGINHRRSFLAQVLKDIEERTTTKETIVSEPAVPSWCPAFMNPTAIAEGVHRRPLWTGLPGNDCTGPFSATDNMSVSEYTMTNFFNDENASKLPITALLELRDTVSAIGPVYSPSVFHLRHDMRQVLQRRLPHARSSLTGLWDSTKVLDEWRKLWHKVYVSRTSLESTSSHQTPFDENGIFNLTLHGGKQGFDIMDQKHSALRDAVCTGRQFFTTERGLCGLGPQGLRVGDETHVILGCQVPVVLRRYLDHQDHDTLKVRTEDQKERELIYVGQAYINELMVYNGDLSEDIRTGKVTLEERFLI